MNDLGSSKVEKRTVSAAAHHNTQHELDEILVGKDVLELVSSAMYINPLTVYREYIQNAADAIDEARTTGLIFNEERGRVRMAINPTTRTTTIRDNGCGIPFREFWRKLTALGASEKRGTLARGFRGVGRLAGLAYARQLVFRSRVANEHQVSELTWDCRQLRDALIQAPYDTNVTEVVREVTKLTRLSEHDWPQRFFEVEMRGVIRLKDDPLLNPLAISRYLSQVAPVPFSPDFHFGSEILERISNYLPVGELDIRIDDQLEPIYRPHLDSITVDGKVRCHFNDLSIRSLPSIDHGVAAVAWILHHNYDGALPSSSLVKGLRVRTGNMQVGGSALLEDLFPETRFNSWSVGEVHIADHRIVPNARRDHFEQNNHFSNLLNHLTPTTREISGRCRSSSVQRRLIRDFEMYAQEFADTIDVIRQGSTNQRAKKRFALVAEQTLLRMVGIANKELLIDTANERHIRIDLLRSRLRQIMHDDLMNSSPLMRLPDTKRKIYEQVFGLIYECSSSRSSAKALIDRILLKVQ